ncbi:MAG: hypothetical protein JNJ57_13435 [Saprospiraceae bacterium]|nr:hypothetical protein [Saprospiraceae bacterium]
MIKNSFVWLLLCMLMGTALAVSGQQNPSPKKPLIVSIFNLGTQLPGSGVLGVFSIPIHPGLSVGTEFLYNSNPKNQFFQTAKIGVFYHQYVQTGVQLYSEAGFRHKIWRGAAAEIRLGAGYLHAFTATEVFKLKEGVYEKRANLGRPQFMVSGALGLSYKLPSNPDAPRFFLEYQFFGQMPFVKSYVPLAPNSVLHVGAAVPMFK